MPLPKQVFNALIDGLSELALLRLPDHPPAKGLPAVALAWEKAFIARAEWHEKDADNDAKRLSVAFAKYAGVAERFPCPKDVLDRLPPRPPPPVLPAPETVECPPEIAAELNKLFNKMSINKEEKNYAKHS